jgi:hypothetical protein
MVVVGPIARALRAREQRSPIYSMFGLRVRSDVPLPLAEQRDGGSDLLVRRAGSYGERPTISDAPIAVIRCEHGTVQCARFQLADGTWIDNGSSVFHIAPNADLVDVYADPAVDPRELALFVIGQVAVSVLRARGAVVLHTSAVVTSGGAAAFLAPKGGGKSSLAAGFVGEGAPLLTDDVLVLDLHGDQALGRPSLAVMKLWQQTLDGIGAGELELPSLLPGIDKKLLRIEGDLRLAEQPAPLYVLYVLDRRSAAQLGDASISITPLSGQQALATLMAQTSWIELLAPAEIAALLPVYARLARQVPVRLLRYPNGFEYQKAVRQAILADMNNR